MWCFKFGSSMKPWLNKEVALDWCIFMQFHSSMNRLWYCHAIISFKNLVQHFLPVPSFKYGLIRSSSKACCIHDSSEVIDDGNLFDRYPRIYNRERFRDIMGNYIFVRVRVHFVEVCHWIYWCNWLKVGGVIFIRFLAKMHDECFNKILVW